MQKNQRTIKILCVVLSLLLAAAACSLTGCGVKANQASEKEQISQIIQTETTAASQATAEFTFTVTDAEGNTQSRQVVTDCKTVGEALLQEGLIDGEQGEYGLYVKTVLGQTYDYDTDGCYWAFYINGEYGLTGVDTTEIVPGSVYEFRGEH